MAPIHAPTAIVSAVLQHEPMNDTEQLLAAVEKTAHTAPRRDKHPLPAPLPAEAVERAEAALGFTLPPLLTALYTRIANGGFGPEYGLMPLIGDRGPGRGGVRRRAVPRAPQGRGRRGRLAVAEGRTADMQPGVRDVLLRGLPQ